MLSGGLTGLIGGFFWFVSRRIDARPEDRKDADIADGAGELGFFSPASYWPFALALSAALMGLALAFFYSWLILIAGRRAADHHRRPAVRVLRGAERHAELSSHRASEGPFRHRGRGPRPFGARCRRAEPLPPSRARRVAAGRRVDGGVPRLAPVRGRRRP